MQTSVICGDYDQDDRCSQTLQSRFHSYLDETLAWTLDVDNRGVRLQDGSLYHRMYCNIFPSFQETRFLPDHLIDHIYDHNDIIEAYIYIFCLFLFARSPVILVVGFHTQYRDDTSLQHHNYGRILIVEMRSYCYKT